MFEKFTERARKVMSLARQEAQRLNSDFIGTEHVLLGILLEGGGVAVKVLKNLSVDATALKAETERLVEHPSAPTATLGQLPFSPRAKRVIELAGEAASQFNHDVIGTEHLLIAILKENEGIGAQVLTNAGLKLDAVKDMTMQVLGTDTDAGSPDYLHRVAVKGTIIDRAQNFITVLQRDGTKHEIRLDLLQVAHTEFSIGRRVEINISSSAKFLD